MAKSDTTSVNRKSDIISAAIAIFAEVGYFRATTAQVAERASISQPYVFRFFATKEALLLAALEASWNRVIESFRKVVETTAPELLETELVQEYVNIQMKYENEMLLQMQAQTIRETAIQQTMRSAYKEIRDLVLTAFRDAGVENAEERSMLFLARGVLCNVAVAINLPELMKG
ncbi:TetR/AcrR family transcriptional regulator [Paenibacillus sacheonensis]|uniref:TetR family transcriptional regulator n=1 Tax=Paenibacillus sacheonensis TaxID=742054 RepID=A0A7X5BZP9_9BACL|nr:TetR/AcrR family transcriptional regulator [Paenibacillus sacheonensis]MBM7567853.1 AcrR family transcriptional regulator [Paenibacillus sacheonensis]NBC70741.1 TetR family transcriptional regulator [Paenibacillus sacheonensis]